MAAPLSRREIRAMERQLSFAPFEFRFDLGVFVNHRIADRFVEAGMAEMMQRMRTSGRQSPLDFVQTLGPRFEVGPSVVDAGVDRSVIAQFEMQRLVRR